MNVDELQSVQARERQTDSLQQLRESFYGDAGEFIQQLRDERDRAAERAEDPFDSPEVNRLSDDIKTAEQTVEAIYERRVGKIVKMASLAAADMPTEDEGLTREEGALFETLLTAIEENREHVLDVLAGEASPGAVTAGASGLGLGDDSPANPTGDDASTSESAPVADGETVADAVAGPDDGDDTVDAADVMGGGESEGAGGKPGDDGRKSNDGGRQSVPPDAPPAGVGSHEGTGADGSPDAGSRDGADDAADVGNRDDAVDRRTVRITDDVGAILGVDEREYDLSTDDVVTLPAANADPLVERDAADPID